MKFTLGWLKDHLDTTAGVDEIAAALTGVGLEVEEIINPGADLAAFTVAKVRQARPHPDADRLRVCDVETKDGLVQVVCGAPNARTGMTGIFAAPGTHIPGTGVDLQTGVIRGVESAGMLCSERELMISDEHDGIIDLDGDFEIGQSAAAALGLDDPVIDIAITPNRPDALGVRGVARDLAACDLGRLKPLAVEPVAGTFTSPIEVTLDFAAADQDACPCFIGRYFRNVKNGPSPDWLANRLRAIGLRPISALVDITNYITYSYGRPLHVFDADKVSGNICARFAKEGETLLALDGKEYALSPGMTVIADTRHAEAIGGIIGGEASGCTGETTNVFLECAYFDPIRTAATGRELNVQTDARYRFERGIDPNFMAPGAELASALILELCGGEASQTVMAGSPPEFERQFSLRPDRVRRLGGLDVSVQKQAEVLQALGFETTGKTEPPCYKVPSWRPDIHGEADLVEEICRIIGLNEIPVAAMTRPHAVARAVLNVSQKRMIAARRRLAQRGLNEAVTYSFLPKSQAELFGGGKAELELANPISSELSDMRPSLIPNLLAAAARNLARGAGAAGLFEVGHIYLGSGEDEQKLCAAGIRCGAGERHWAGTAAASDLFAAKQDGAAALTAAGAPVVNLQIASGGPDWLHPGRCGTWQLGPKNQLGCFGELHPAIAEIFELSGRIAVFEIILDNIPAAKQKTATRPALQISDQMPLSRDFAFVMDNDVPAQTVIRAVRGADKQMITDVRIFDLFTGASIGDGKKSLAVEVMLQPQDKTLTDAEIESISAKIIDKVTGATGGILRQ